jgi:hypothetical protein
MSARGLNEVVGRGCISQTFRQGLMNGQRAELIRLPEFELEPEEARALLAIKADTFADFAAAVEALVAQRESRAARAEGPFRVSLRWPSAANTGVYIRQPR